MKINSCSVKFYLELTKVRHDGHAIFCRIIIDRKKAELKLPFCCCVSDWDDVSGQPKSKSPDAQIKLGEIARIQSIINNAINDANRARRGNSKNSEVPPPWYEDENSEIITENQEELNQSPELNIYPNPSTSKIELNISGLKAVNGAVEVCSITGKRIYFAKISSEKTIIDVSNFTSGIYICKYVNDYESFILTQQIIIQSDAN